MGLSWPGTVHLICEWHFIKNVKEKLKGKLGDSTWQASAKFACPLDLMLHYCIAGA